MSKDKARFAMIYEHFLLLLKDVDQAILMDKFVFLTEQEQGNIEWLEEKIADGTLNIKQEEVEKVRGWITKPVSWFCEHMVIGSSPKTVARKIDEMVDKGFLVKNSSQGKVAAYKLNIPFLKKEIAKIGYTIKGFVIADLTEEIEEEFKEPPKIDNRKTSTEVWEALPKESRKEKREEKKPLPKSTVNPEEADKDWNAWVRGQKRLDQSPDYLKRVAWLIHYYTGFDPGLKTYLADLMMLYKASGNDEGVLIAGLQAGESARLDVTKSYVYSGPRSYLSFINNERSLKNKPVQTTEGKQPGKSPPMNGQAVVRTKTGEEVLMLGGKKRERS